MALKNAISTSSKYHNQPASKHLMRLHIVRHGQTDWNAMGRIQGQLDSELDDTGIQQAIERGNDFDKSELAAIYASSSVRTRQTAHHILKGQDEDLILMDELREVKLGVWEGQMWADIQKQYPDMVHAHRHASEAFKVEGAETSSETQTRGVAAVESIIDRHAQGDNDDEVLVVSHGAIMKTILAHYIDVPLCELHQLPPLPNCAHCIIDADVNKRQVVQIASQPIGQTPWNAYL